MAQNDNTPESKGLFRTPLACAMLSGALAGGAYFLMNIFLRSIFHERAPELQVVLRNVVVTAFQLSGPLIWSRNPMRRLAMIGVLLGAFDSIVATNSPATQMAYMEAVNGLLIGAFLCVLYRRSEVAGLCCVLGAVAASPSVLETFLTRYGHTVYNRDWLALAQMLTLLAIIIQVVIPTIPIDRAIRKDEQHLGKFDP